MRLLIRELTAYLTHLLAGWPGGSGQAIRSFFLKQRFRRAGALRIGQWVDVIGFGNISLGENVSIMRFSSLYAHDGLLSIGNNASISTNVCLDASDQGEIVIGDDVLIGPNVVLRASDHNFSSMEKPINQQGHSGGRIAIGNDVWIGANTVITRNVSVGDHAVIAAGSVVTSDIPSGVIAAGVPATIKKSRTETQAD
jgi:galactoside O-acetyltransferase